MGLQIVYGGDVKDGLIGSGDYVGAMAAGAKVVKAEFMGCRENCVYGVSVSEVDGFAAWLATGDALGFRFRQDKKLLQVPGKLDGFAAAEEAMPIDSSRRLDPGAHSDPDERRARRPGPTDAPAGLVPAAE